MYEIKFAALNEMWFKFQYRLSKYLETNFMLIFAQSVVLVNQIDFEEIGWNTYLDVAEMVIN